MWNKLRNYAVLSLALFLVSLILFSAAMPRFASYLSILCVIEWICIFLYKRKNNRQFFCAVLCMEAGSALAFVLQWFLMGRAVEVSNIDRLESIVLALLLIGAVYIGLGLCVECARKRHQTPEAQPEAPRLFPERAYDLQRLRSFLDSGAPLIGVNAHWGDGKTFMIDHLCAMDQVRSQYEIIRVNVLAGHEDEIELAMINEFDHIFRRNRIFSVASKQMLKFLESNDILKQFQWLLIRETQSVSSTFLNVLSDLEKLDKKVLVIVDDIERLGDEALIRKVFALMESISSKKVQIVYLFNNLMLAGFDRDYLEKYIPCYMNLTPIRFRSIVHALWDELKMDATLMKREDTGYMTELPNIDPTIMDILELDWAGGSHPFRLENITVRRVRVFMEEFRDLVESWSKSGETIFSEFSEIHRELLLKCLFIKHFLHNDYEQIKIATDLIDSFLFRLSEDVKALLAEYDPQVPDQVTLHYLFDIRRRMDRREDVQRFMTLVLKDDGNYNRLLALAMLGFDYRDVLRDIRKQRPAKARDASVQDRNRRDQYMLKKEQIGNEDISDIERNRNNERINRVMWNLVANGSSEWANLDAYAKHFQRTVLAAAPEDQQKAWEQFASDAWNENIYKNNKTQQKLAIDPYLPLFQGFRIINTDAGQWMKLLDFYFQQENERGISAEMLQNLNYVDMTDHRVYISVLKHFVQCGITGSLNSEPCMYRFLTQTLRMVSGLGYTRSSMFHSLWYLANETPDPNELFPSQRWKKATEELTAQFGSMKRVLEQEKRRIPHMEWFCSDIDTIIQFIDKCGELSQAERSLGMSTVNVNVSERSQSRHQEVCDNFKQDMEDGMEVDKWFEQLHSAYDRGELDPLEIKELSEFAREREQGSTSCAAEGPIEEHLS